MKRLRTLAILLIATFSLAACGGGGAEQPDQADSPDGQNTAPATGSTAADETGPEDNAAEESDAREDTQRDRDGDTTSEAAGTSVTTLDGERVNVGGGDATALFFMAGW